MLLVSIDTKMIAIMTTLHWPTYCSNINVKMYGSFMNDVINVTFWKWYVNSQAVNHCSSKQAPTVHQYISVLPQFILQCLDARASSHGAGQATVWEDEKTEEGRDRSDCNERTGNPLLPAWHSPARVLQRLPHCGRPVRGGCQEMP